MGNVFQWLKSEYNNASNFVNRNVVQPVENNFRQNVQQTQQHIVQPVVRQVQQQVVRPAQQFIRNNPTPASFFNPKIQQNIVRPAVNVFKQHISSPLSGFPQQLKQNFPNSSFNRGVVKPLVNSYNQQQQRTASVPSNFVKNVIGNNPFDPVVQGKYAYNYIKSGVQKTLQAKPYVSQLSKEGLVSGVNQMGLSSKEVLGLKDIINKPANQRTPEEQQKLLAMSKNAETNQGMNIGFMGGSLALEGADATKAFMQIAKSSDAYQIAKTLVDKLGVDLETAKNIAPDLIDVSKANDVKQAVAKAVGGFVDRANQLVKTGINKPVESTTANLPNTQPAEIGGANYGGREFTPQVEGNGAGQIPAGAGGEAKPGASKFTLLNTPEANTAANPVKVEIKPIAEGDYQGARIQAQSVENKIQVAKRQLVSSVQSLSKNDQNLFRYAKEDPNLIKTAENPNLMQEAVSRANRLTDSIHANSQAVGGNTNYLDSYWHHTWDLSNPEQAKKFQALGGDVYAPDFTGVNSQPRVFHSIKQGEQAGFSLKHTNPIQDINNYADNATYQLKQATLKKGMLEADAKNLIANGSARTPTGESLGYSKKAIQEMNVYNRPINNNIGVKAYRTANKAAKQTILSLSQFHPINIGMQAVPTALLGGHPGSAGLMVWDTAASLISKGHADKVIESFIKDGTMEKAATMGTPILHGSDFSAEGVLALTKKFGEDKIFGQQMPVMHGRLVQSVVADLERKGIALDSQEGRAAGDMVNKIMGFVNNESRGLDPRVQRALSDVALAPQFTRTKWETIGSALNLLKWDYAHMLARKAVVGKYATEVAVGLAVGYLVGQKSDNFVDTLKRMLIKPSIATPWKDDKGNNIQLNLPANFISELAGLAFTLGRDQNGRVTMDFKPGEIPANLASYGRSRLAVIPGAVLKVATNTNYAGKPLYDPNASLKDKFTQGITTLGQGALPIGLQGAVYNPKVMSLLPKTSQDILNANKPGAQPFLKSVGSSFGFTPVTDKTVGLGLHNTRFYNGVDEAKQGLDHQGSNVVDNYFGSKKNPVTGQYEVMPSVWDATTKARELLQNSTPGQNGKDALDNIITMNQNLNSQGEKVDPMWLQSRDNIVKTLEYQAMDTGPQKTFWYNQNKTWYQPIADLRGKFFDSLPPSDPNKPSAPIEYPQPTSQVQSLMDKYYSMTDSTQKYNFMKQNPSLQNQMDKQVKYANDVLVAKGQAAQKTYPKMNPQMQNFTDQYMAADKATRKNMRNSNPQQYQAMIGYFDSTDLYTIGTNAAQNQLVGNPDSNSKENKAISSLAQDIYQNADGSYSVVPAGWMQGLTNGSSSSYSAWPKKPKQPFSKSFTKSFLSKSMKAPKKLTMKGLKKSSTKSKLPNLTGRSGRTASRKIKLTI